MQSRFRSIALIAALALVAVPAAQAAPEQKAADHRPSQPTVDTLAVSQTFASMTFSFSHPGDVANFAVDSERLAPTLSERSQKAIQSVAVDMAFETWRSSRNFGDSTFAGSLLHATIEDMGITATRKFAVDFCRYHGVKSDQLRILLRAIADRDPGDSRNRSS